MEVIYESPQMKRGWTPETEVARSRHQASVDQHQEHNQRVRESGGSNYIDPSIYEGRGWDAWMEQLKESERKREEAKRQ